MAEVVYVPRIPTRDKRSIDELAEPARRLLVELYDWIHTLAESSQVAVDEVRFTRRAAREALGWGSTQFGLPCRTLLPVFSHEGGGTPAAVGEAHGSQNTHCSGEQ